MPYVPSSHPRCLRKSRRCCFYFQTRAVLAFPSATLESRFCRTITRNKVAPRIEWNFKTLGERLLELQAISALLMKGLKSRTVKLQRSWSGEDGKKKRAASAFEKTLLFVERTLSALRLRLSDYLCLHPAAVILRTSRSLGFTLFHAFQFHELFCPRIMEKILRLEVD